MSSASLRTAGVLLIVLPTVVFGGASLLWHWITARTAYYEHPLRRILWRAGHAHAGVLLILSLVALTLVDRANLGDGWKQVVRTSFPLAALLLPIAYFLSIARPDADRVGARYCVVAGQAAFRYSLMRPSHRDVRATCSADSGASAGFSSAGLGG